MVAGAAGRPLLLTDVTTLSASTKAFLAANSREAIVIGATSAVSADVEAAVCTSFKR